MSLFTEIDRQANMETSLAERFLPPEGLVFGIERSESTPTGFEILYTSERSGRSNIFLGQMAALHNVRFTRSVHQLAIKTVNAKSERGIFATSGMEAEITLGDEGRVLELQEAVGVAPGFVAYKERGFGEIDRGEVTLFPQNKECMFEPVQALLKFSEDLRFDRVYKNGTLISGTEVEKDIAGQLVGRMLSMRVVDNQAKILKLCSSRGVLDLICDGRMQDLEEDKVFGEQAVVVNRAVEGLLSDFHFGKFLAREIQLGRAGEQHGDVRARNIFLAERVDGYEAFPIDPVRLHRLDENSGNYERMNKWWTTHDYFQLGLLCAMSYCDPNRQGFVKEAVDAYMEQELGDDLMLADDSHGRLLGLGLVYGLAIEFHVLNYLRAEEGIEEKLHPYMKAMVHLVKSDFVGWKEVLDG